MRYRLLTLLSAGAVAGYMFGRKNLRRELARSESPEHAVRLIVTHLAADSKKFVQDVRSHLRSERGHRAVRTLKQKARQVLPHHTRPLARNQSPVKHPHQKTRGQTAAPAASITNRERGTMATTSIAQR